MKNRSDQEKKPSGGCQTNPKQPAFLSAPPSTAFPAAANAEMGGGEKSGLDEINNSVIQGSGARSTRLGKLYLLDTGLLMGGTDVGAVHSTAVHTDTDMGTDMPILWHLYGTVFS